MNGICDLITALKTENCVTKDFQLTWLVKLMNLQMPVAAGSFS